MEPTSQPPVPLRSAPNGAIEYYKFCADDYAKNFHSLRSVEWLVAFQAYIGYAAITLGFTYVADSAQPLQIKFLVGVSGIVATLLLFAITLYTAFRILERMHDTRDKSNFYIGELRKCVSVEGPVSDPPKLDKQSSFAFWVNLQPIHGRWYAFGAQSIVGLMWVLGLVVYISLRLGILASICIK